MVYNFAQFRARQALQETNQTVPNQVGKPINNPTLKWIFQIMEGISIVKTSTEAIITNIDVLRCKNNKAIWCYCLSDLWIATGVS